MKNGKWVPWRVIVCVISVMAIIYMWSTKDLAAVYGALPAGAVIPFIVTNVMVTLVKVLSMAAVIWLVKWVAGKMRREKEAR